jgi:putative aldouronate transport system permease protein
MAFSMLFPFWHTLVGSLMTYKEYMNKKVLLYPERPTLEAYRVILSSGLITDPMKVSILVTLTGTLLSLFCTSFCAYGLSKRYFGSSVVINIMVITMIVNPGLIPVYLLYRRLGLINNLLVYILPNLINTFYLIIMRTYFMGFSRELEEAARMDGCSAYGIFFRIVLPLSKSMLATIGLFFAVNYWNIYFQSLFFVNDADKKTLQDYLQRIIMSETMMDQMTGSLQGDEIQLYSETTKMANVIIVVFPIIVVYPFLQKYFVQGAMIGALKG